MRYSMRRSARPLKGTPAPLPCRHLALLFSLSLLSIGRTPTAASRTPPLHHASALRGLPLPSRTMSTPCHHQPPPLPSPIRSEHPRPRLPWTLPTVHRASGIKGHPCPNFEPHHSTSTIINSIDRPILLCLAVAPDRPGAPPRPPSRRELGTGHLLLRLSSESFSMLYSILIPNQFLVSTVAGLSPTST